MIGRSERRNIVLFGVPDEHRALDGATTEEAKIQKGMNAVDCDPEMVVRSHKLLGQRAPRSNRPRPLLIKVDSKSVRDKILEKTMSLKNMNEPYKRMYIKKDSHPEVREDWKRLKDAEEEEMKKPLNTGCNIP